jgi:hypothetical protein
MRQQPRPKNDGLFQTPAASIDPIQALRAE